MGAEHSHRPASPQVPQQQQQQEGQQPAPATATRKSFATFFSQVLSLAVPPVLLRVVTLCFSTGRRYASEVLERLCSLQCRACALSGTLCIQGVCRGVLHLACQVVPHMPTTSACHFRSV